METVQSSTGGQGSLWRIDTWGVRCMKDNEIGEEINVKKNRVSVFKLQMFWMEKLWHIWACGWSTAMQCSSGKNIKKQKKTMRKNVPTWYHPHTINISNKKFIEINETFCDGSEGPGRMWWSGGLRQIHSCKKIRTPSVNNQLCLKKCSILFWKKEQKKVNVMLIELKLKLNLEKKDLNNSHHLMEVIVRTSCLPLATFAPSAEIVSLRDFFLTSINPLNVSKL